MKKANRKLVLLVIGCVVLLAVSQGALAIIYQKSIEQESLVSILESERATLDAENNVLGSQITELQTQKASYVDNLSILESHIASLRAEIVVLENDVTESYDAGFEEGEAEGYLKGVIDGAGSGYNIRDPTYAEALAFITSDKTNEKSYDESYLCWNFVADFKNNAFEAGYRAGNVFIEFPDSAHAITCFNTTDKGLIFVEPQDDQIVTVSVGRLYWDRTMYEVDYDDTVVRYEIIW